MSYSHRVPPLPPSVSLGSREILDRLVHRFLAGPDLSRREDEDLVELIRSLMDRGKGPDTKTKMAESSDPAELFAAYCGTKNCTALLSDSPAGPTW